MSHLWSAWPPSFTPPGLLGPGGAAIDMTQRSPGRPSSRRACRKRTRCRVQAGPFLAGSLPILFRPLSRSYDREAGSRSSASPGRPAAELQRPGGERIRHSRRARLPLSDRTLAGIAPRWHSRATLPRSARRCLNSGRRSPMGDAVSLRAGLAISTGDPTGTSAARPPGTAIGRM